ncbi:hypothetical protein [Algoriphagus persicinus]|uniref:hypothetical protein n=1 Tax=Algoriphagus persicinus TaxID=3108754 RepID=UPI002B3F3648|nr:hypothetical protein [Algoriphagus sp. E1-3-M2]MEB2785229.1 hypothetical protein [Algoriphagus sp. E1-3-M2]
MTDTLVQNLLSEKSGDGFKVLFTSRSPITQLIGNLQNFEIETEWLPLTGESNTINEGFTYPILKSAFEYAVESQADLLIAVDPDLNLFAVGVRKFVNSSFVLLNIHQLTLLLTKLLLENHAGMELHRSLLIAEVAEKLFTYENLPIKTYAELKSPLETSSSLLAIPDGALIVSENQELLLKGHRNSLEYLLGSLILESKKLKARSLTLFETMVQIYQSHGYQREKLFSVSLEGHGQKQFYKKIFEKLRKKPPGSLGMYELVSIEDLHNGTIKNLLSGRIIPSDSPYASAIQIQLSNQVRFLMYPQDKKVYFLFISTGKEVSIEEFGRINQQYDRQVLKLIHEINRLGLSS